MKRIALSLTALLTLAATPALAQNVGNMAGSNPGGGFGDMGGPGYTGRDVIWAPGDVGILPTTPSRMERSHREMNRGRIPPYELRMTRRQVRVYTADLLERAEIQCDIADAEIVARTPQNIPAIEVHCAQGSGLVIVDTFPIQATDCLDFAPVEGEASRSGPLAACRLPRNVAAVAAARQSAESARN